MGEPEPRAAARRWAEGVASGDVAGLLWLFAPAPRLHVGEEILEGHTEVQAYLAGKPYGNLAGLRFEIRGRGPTMTVRWKAARGQTQKETRLRVEGGRIVELWE